MNGNQDNLQGPAPLPGEPSSRENWASQPVSQTLPPSAPAPLSTPSPSVPPFEPPKPSGVGAPPPPDIGIRTMASDLSSLKSSGGLEPKAKTFKPEDFSTEAVFEPAGPGSESRTNQSSNSHKPLYIILGIVGFVVIAGLVIYFFILPLIKSPAPTPVDNNPPPQTNNPTPLAPIAHKSFFTVPAASVVPMNLSNLNLAEVGSALNAAAVGVNQGSLTEVNMTVNNVSPESSDFLSTVFPQLDKTILTSNLERDFTVFIYRDANGSWPGYVFKVSEGGSMDSAAMPFKAVVETSPNLSDLFLTNIGQQSSTGFKDGLKVGTSTARYVSFATTGASFNYGWFSNYLVVSTSFNGFKEALKALGLSS